MAIKDYIRKIGSIIEFISIIPFIPILLGMLLFFGWVFSILSMIPEDLEEQVRCANRQNLKEHRVSGS